MDTAGARYLARWELDDVDGVVVVIDVLRAFTTAAYAFAAGASTIWMMAGVDEALAFARTIPRALVVGEEGGRRPEGFDLPNSPVAVAAADLDGRVLVQRTTAGTQGVIAARNADRVFAASLVCASATASAVRATTSSAPTYVITGRFPDQPDWGEDDLLTAQLIERARAGAPLAADAAAKAIVDSPEAERTLSVGVGHADPDDITYAVDVDRFDFAMIAERVDAHLRLVRHDPS